MQAKDIRIGGEYAVMADGKLASIRVTKVVTTRVGAHASDFTHKIIGMVTGYGEHEYGLSGILGEYQQYAELVARKQQEEQERKNVARFKEQRALDLIAMLYRMTGTEPSANDHYSDPFRSRYNGGIELNNEGVERLFDALQNRPGLKAVS